MKKSSPTPAPKKSYIKHKIIAGAILVAMGSGVYQSIAYACEGCTCGYQTGTVAGKFMAGMATSAAAQKAAAAAIAAWNYLMSERTTAALGINVKAVALGGQTVSAAAVDAQEALAHAISAVEAQRRTTQAAVSHSAEFGQGFQPCRVIAKQQAIADAMSDMPARVARDVSKHSAAPGRKAPREPEQEAIDNANKAACCAGWADIGYCTKPENESSQCATVEASTLQKECKQGDACEQEQIGFINNMTGPGTKAMSNNAEKSVEGEAVNMALLGVHARYSPATVSLQAIAADNTVRSDGHSDDPDGLSLNGRFRREAMRYMGAGEDSLAWSRVMAQQEEHGLLIELLRAKALDLALMERQYRQYERIEAVLAGLTATAGQEAAAQTATSATQANVEAAQ